MNLPRYYMAVRREGTDPLLGSYGKIALPANTMAEALARLPGYLHAFYSLHAVSPRASRQIEAMCRTSERAP